MKFPSLVLMLGIFASSAGATGHRAPKPPRVKANPKAKAKAKAVPRAPEPAKGTTVPLTDADRHTELLDSRSGYDSAGDDPRYRLPW